MSISHTAAIRYLVCKLRRFKHYLRRNRAISIIHESGLESIRIYSISPVVVNLCAKSLLAILGVHWVPGASVVIGATRMMVSDIYCMKSRVMTNLIYSIKITLEFSTDIGSLSQIACKRLCDVMYNPDLLPFELIDRVADWDPIISIRYILG